MDVYTTRVLARDLMLMEEVLVCVMGSYHNPFLIIINKWIYKNLLHTDYLKLLCTFFICLHVQCVEPDVVHLLFWEKKYQHISKNLSSCFTWKVLFSQTRSELLIFCRGSFCSPNFLGYEVHWLAASTWAPKPLPERQIKPAHRPVTTSVTGLADDYHGRIMCGEILSRGGRRRSMLWCDSCA